MKSIILIFIGGGLGSVLRYLIATFFSTKLIPFNFPLSTLVSNLFSCGIAGMALLFLSTKDMANTEIKLFITIGLCGGLSTFSTFSYENFILIKNANYITALFNISISILSCLAIFFFLLRKSNF